VFFVLFRNLCALVTSGDLFRVYCVGFVLSFLVCFQVWSGFMLSWVFVVGFVLCWSGVLVFVFDFEVGFFLRSVHIVVTSLVYGFLYVHVFRCFFLLLLFDVSLLVWCVGGFLYGVVVFVAFMGYVLPCTQMSYWGLTVFSNVVSVVPFFGLVLCYWLWGCEYIQDFTLVKCHAFHVILPLLLLGFVVFHFFCLHYFLSSDGFCERFVFCYERVLFVLWFYFRDLGFCVCLLCGYGYCVFCYWYFVFS